MLVATDLDGTLVPNDSTRVGDYTAEVLRRVDDAGTPVVTARPLRWMDPFWPYVGKHGLAVVSNGAITYDVHAREAISTSGIGREQGLELTAAITAAVPGSAFAIECLDGIRQDPEFGVSPREVVAFGDMPNDIPMLTWAGTSFAVANAHESVLTRADQVAPPYEEEGVAQVLDALLKDDNGSTSSTPSP